VVRRALRVGTPEFLFHSLVAGHLFDPLSRLRGPRAAKPWCFPMHGKRSSLTGGRANAWCLLIHWKRLRGDLRKPGASFTRGSSSLSRGPGAWYLLIHGTRLSITGGRAKARCLLVHAEASVSHGGESDSQMPPCTRRRKRRSLYRGGKGKSAGCGASLYTDPDASPPPPPPRPRRPGARRSSRRTRPR